MMEQQPDGARERPAGTVDEDANPPLTDPETAEVGGGGETIPPQDTGSAVPPYEGRQASATSIGEQGSSTKGGAGIGGATQPVADPEYKSPAPGDTEGGATASPADEQPAAQQPETDRDDDAPGPAHTTGTGRGEGKSS
ncbi:MAG: hypothetical protein J2P16_16225 [Mycobacterium sp.]|nr:hypothetical protein [Mycobacterium sp.]